MQENGSRDNADGSRADGIDIDFVSLANAIKRQAAALGFSACGIAPARIDPAATDRFQRWLAAGQHGDMDYMAKHAPLRAHPPALLAGARSVISVRLPYWPQPEDKQVLTDANSACVSRYALGRDYHKTIRQRLQKLADYIQETLSRHSSHDSHHATAAFAYRACADSAPVMETELAQRAGIGWRGKHTLTLSRQGSWHFLGELLTNLPLPADTPAENHCGRCQRCLDACPTEAIVAPYTVDARRCISYLTIELHGTIPIEFRPLIGNRIYGCDDCQHCCPWNRFAQGGDPDFAVRNRLDRARLTDLFAWRKEEFEQRLAGSPIRRIGHDRWLRNIAVALGNALPDNDIIDALSARADDPSALVREHVAWALAQHTRPGNHDTKNAR